MDNRKIDRKRAQIAMTEAGIEGLKNKLREQKMELTALENSEIIALYRNEKLNEDEFAALLKERRGTRHGPACADAAATAGTEVARDEG